MVCYACYNYMEVQLVHVWGMLSMSIKIGIILLYAFGYARSHAQLATIKISRWYSTSS